MSRDRFAGLLCTAILSALLFFPSAACPTSLETTIDLSYSYSQDHLGDSVTGSTKVLQMYGIAYESALTSIFDLLLKVSVEVEDNFEDDAAETSKLSPSIQVEVVGPRAAMNLTYDAARSRTEQYRTDAGGETFDNTYKGEFEVKPDYLPAVKLVLERKRKYEESTSEQVEQLFQLQLRKDIDDLQLEFTYDSKDSEQFPGKKTGSDVAWTAAAAYQSTVWWDVDVDLTYEIEETYSENFRKNVFIEDEKEYLQNVKLGLRKSLDLTPRLEAELEYSYEFEQDLILREFDYNVSQDMGLALDYLLLHWLKVGAEFTRETESDYDVPPRDKSQSLSDAIILDFSAKPRSWIQFAGQSKWQFDKDMKEDTGATVDDVDSAIYKLSMRQKWGKWWTLVMAGGSEYKYTDGWVTKKKGNFKAGLQLAFYHFSIEPSYEVSREVKYEEFSALDFEHKKEEEFGLTLDYSRDFSNYIETAFTHTFTLNMEESVDEVLNFEEVIQLTEETKIRVALVDIIRNLSLEGEVTRKATDTEHDDEPMLVNIAYALNLDWVVKDIELGLTFKYDDNGDSFDESSINTKVAWQYEEMTVAGEYQLDQTYAYEIDEQRKFNLKMSVVF